MKLLWHSNSPWAGTGYGMQTALFVPMLKEAGYDVAISAFYGLQGAMLNWNGIDIYPGGVHQYGNDVLLHHARRHFGGDLEDGLILTLVDVWVLDAASHTRARVGNWTPVDHEPPPAHVTAYFECSGSVPIAMSRFGEQQLRNVGLDPLYVPHGVDTGKFCPMDRAQCRQDLGLPESAFVVGVVAANKGFPPRKAFPQSIQAFAEFAKAHEDAILFIHSEPGGLINGVNLQNLLAGCGVRNEQVRISDQYQWFLGFPQEHMIRLYNAFDVLLNPAFGEGFGIPVVEAQSCGTPVIVSDWTAMPELCGAGWKVGGQRWWSEQGSWQQVPSVAEIVVALEDAYGQNGGLREKAREFALQYDARRVLDEFMLPALVEMERRTLPPVLPPVVSLPEKIAA